MLLFVATFRIYLSPPACSALCLIFQLRVTKLGSHLHLYQPNLLTTVCRGRGL